MLRTDVLGIGFDNVTQDEAVDRAMEITGIHLVEKSGGKSGHFRYPAPAEGSHD